MLTLCGHRISHFIISFPVSESVFKKTYVNRITKGREQIVNKTFVKMMDELGYDVELTYKKKAAE